MTHLNSRAVGRYLKGVALVAFFLLPFQGFQAQTKGPGTMSDSYEKVRQLFLNPPAEFRSVPLWVWNDKVTKQQIDEQLSDYRARGLGGAFIHPRPGLITEYLSDEWFALCKYAVGKGKQLGLKIWLYDENSYPSGFAGGHVPAQMPDAIRSGLGMSHGSQLPATWSTEPLLVLQKKDDGFVDITKAVKSGNPGSGDFYVFTVVRQKPNPWHGGFTYVDLMRRDVTEKFLDVTLNAYKKAIGKEFGKVVPGVFQDEAEINPATQPDMPGVNYTPALFDVFQSQWGYDLKLQLPSVYEDVGEYLRVRHDFYSTLLDMFIEGWAKPYYEYCTKNNLVFTGHYWEHEWPRPVVSPDNLAMAAFAHMPGIDILMNEYRTDSHAQFGNARAVREIRSAANQLGRQRTMSETFGAGGWDMTFFDQKRIADWEYALGVNFINQHLSYMTIKGARKTDHPLSFSYHEPWWKNYNVLADYFGRMSVATSLGSQENRILVIEPTTTAWMFYAPKGDRSRYQGIEKGFQDFVNTLEAAQIEYDLGSERTIRDHGKIVNDQFAIGQRAYDLVILPPTMENLDRATFTLLSQFLASNGRILCYGEPPAYLNGERTDLIRKFAEQYAKNWTKAAHSQDVAAIERLSPPAVQFDVQSPPDQSERILFHQTRTFKDFNLVLLVNTSDKMPVGGTVTATGRGCEEWDALAGAVKARPFRVEGDKVQMEFDIPRGGSLLICFRSKEAQPGRPPKKERSIVATSSSTTMKSIDKNVLAIDYCELTLGGKTEKDLYFYDAQTRIYQFHGLPVNPWDHAVQYKKNIVDKDTFSSKSGFEATFAFTITGDVKKNTLEAVIERPELYQVSVNGTTIRAQKGKWWLDKAFGVFDIGAHVVDGANTITLKSSPFTIHTELQPIFILGDFALESVEKGFQITTPKEIKFGAWAEQGMPMYGGGVAYSKKYQLSSVQMNALHAFVRLGAWSGVVAEVNVNGKSVGPIAFEPFERDISKYLRAGNNEVSVIVYGSLKNTLGPHHNNPLLGRAWPGGFQQGAKEGRPAGSAYSIVGYGLFDDFILQLEGK